MEKKDINKLNNSINNLGDNLSIITEKNPETIEGKYNLHCSKLKFEDIGFLDKENIMNISESLLSSIDLDGIYIDLISEPIKEDIIKIKAIKTKNFSNYLLSNLIDYFNDILKDTELLKIHKIISKIELKDDKIIIYSNYLKQDFDFNQYDIQIKAVEDYLILKDVYNLNYNEIKELSKKQKRYLIYKVKNNKNNEKN